MRRFTDLDWLPLMFGLMGTLLILGLASSPQTQAAERLLQTVPTPTPRTVPTPSGPATPAEPGESSSSPGGSTSTPNLTLSQSVRPDDVLPGEQFEFSLWLTNTSAVALTDIIVVDALDSMLALLEVQCTQGVVRFEDGTLFIDLGTLEPGETALLILRVQLEANARPGTIILNQFTAHVGDSEEMSNIVAAGLPPDALPATGRDLRAPIRDGRGP